MINTLGEKSEYNPKRDRVLHSKESTTIIKGCVYCEGDHRSSERQNISSTNEGKKILSEKRLRFNCTGKNHSAMNCARRTHVKYVTKNTTPQFVILETSNAYKQGICDVPFHSDKG